MTDEMTDEDDLLDDIAEMEKQTKEKEMEDGRIEAISQLSPERPTNKTSVSKVKTGMLNIQGVEKGGRPGNTMEKKNKQRSQQNASLGRKRGARSPDLKGASASRKLAGRGRLSPKSKSSRKNQISDTIRSNAKLTCLSYTTSM
ncbi:hypothetical protein YC2023_059979 [Brassica napus]